MPDKHTIAACGPAPLLDLSALAYPPTQTANPVEPYPEYDHTVLCDPVTEQRVILTTFYDPDTPPITEAFNLDGSPYGGSVSALVRCAAVVTESDAVQFCAAGNDYFQHVVKEDGQPTGDVYWTDVTGAVVPAPTSPTPGACASVTAANSQQTDLVDIATGQDIYRETLYNADGSVFLTQLYYNDPITGAKIVTTSGFTAAQPQKNGPFLAYETLANGVVEKLDKYVTLDTAGIPQAPELYQYGTGTAYTAVDPTRVEPKPIKVQMASGTIEVTGAATDISGVLGPATVNNSEGEPFPQHGVFHVNADADGVGAGIAYTTDGSTPGGGTGVEFEVSAGQSFQLDTWQEMRGLQMIAIGNQGDAGATATSVDVSYELNNISPDKDDV